MYQSSVSIERRIQLKSKSYAKSLQRRLDESRALDVGPLHLALCPVLDFRLGSKYAAARTCHDVAFWSGEALRRGGVLPSWQ